MITKEILESHPVSVLKKEISKTNIKGYSKMKKTEIVSLMLKPEHSKRFSHIKKKGEEPKKESPKKESPKKIVIKRKPKAEEPKKESPKKIVIKRKFKVLSADCSNALIQAENIERFYNKNKGVFSKDKYLIKNKVELESQINNIKKLLNDPKCQGFGMTPPFKTTLKKAIELHNNFKKIVIKRKPKAEAPAPAKVEAPAKKNIEKEVKKIKEEINKIRRTVYTEQFNLKQLRQKIKSKEDIQKINKELTDIQKEANKKQSDLKKYENELTNDKNLRPLLNEMKFDKERYEKRLISIVRNLSKIVRSI